MKLTDNINRTLVKGLIGLSIIAASCTVPAESKSNKQVHKDCYGLHIKENPTNIEVEVYKEGWKIHQDNLTSDTIIIQITKDAMTYKYKNFSERYLLEMKDNGISYKNNNRIGGQ